LVGSCRLLLFGRKAALAEIRTVAPMKVIVSNSANADLGQVEKLGHQLQTAAIRRGITVKGCIPKRRASARFTAV